jgi:hypothetical protein
MWLFLVKLIKPCRDSMLRLNVVNYLRYSERTGRTADMAVF